MAQERSISGYGCDYEHRVSRAIAIKLCAPWGIPKAGYEVRIKKGKCPDRHYGLWLKNVSGTFVITSASDSKDCWQEVYGFELP